MGDVLRLSNDINDLSNITISKFLQCFRISFLNTEGGKLANLLFIDEKGKWLCRSKESRESSVHSLCFVVLKVEAHLVDGKAEVEQTTATSDHQVSI